MAHWPDIIVRQVVMALAQRGMERGHFVPDGTDQLWAWQGKRRVAIKEALGLELPAVYSPPQAKIIEGDEYNPVAGQVWQIDTERDSQMEVHLRSAPPAADQTMGYIIRAFDQSDRKTQEAFCESMSELGQTGLTMSLRGAESTAKLMELAEVYLGLGRCYAEATAVDLMRVVDHLENHFGVEGEPVILVLSGLAIPPGLAYAAIDQRIGGLIIDYTDAPKAVSEPTGVPPFFLGQYANLGPNPGLVMLQCCATRPMVVIGQPPDANEAWLKDPKSGVLSFADQLDQLKQTYESADVPERLTVIGPDQPKPAITELVTKIMEHFSEVGE